MKISILIDNTPGVSTWTEFGLSYFIEFSGKQILFDTAQTNLFLENALSMNLRIDNADFIVLSHGHFDHGDGLENLNGGNLICHPECFVKRYRKSDKSYIGLKHSKEFYEKNFNLTATCKPFQLFDGAYFLGEIPRVAEFESRTTPFVFNDGTPDFVMDDSALALKCPEGLVVVTGCGHSGIVNTLEYAKMVTGENRIFGIIGGFHLKENNKQTQETINYLKENAVKHIYPSHCTALPALAEFFRHFKIREVKTGDVISFC
jgi:7,8-dihydropterin-6-yl-methyl-4-(beta-D-ribofuranosyl)aminobenzene 5'-phosphate synthase